MRVIVIFSFLLAIAVTGALVFRDEIVDDLASTEPSKRPQPQNAGSSGDSSDNVAPTTAAPESAPQVSSGASSEVSNAPVAPSLQAPAAGLLKVPDSLPELKAPTFDVVRVNPSGDAVLAGRAAPGAMVTVRAGDKLIGKVLADERGEWVLVPAMPLASGSRELSLEAQDPTSNKIQLSDDVVVIAVPERNAGGQSIAILTPRKGGGASKVLQAPRPKPTPQAAPSPTPTAAPTAAPTATPKPSPAVASASVVAAQVVANVTTEQAARASTPPPPVSLDSVDYDDTGSLILAGRADAGAPVNVYVDNKLVGGVKATAGGKWQITPQSNVQPGDHKLRVDQTDASGKVQYRVELPFSRAEPAAIKLVRGQVIVQPGNSLWRIARHSYGSGTLYSVIYEANRSQIRDPDLIYPGQIFKVPTAGGSDG